ncbi:MAG TPA: SIS domain-containing protein [Nitrospirae bacterium]|nr:SIS domain-containing protein [Nitrospirota bacterium]HDZ00719.1 SIS domain-containing protein [Nitrospirota bacterium]
MKARLTGDRVIKSRLQKTLDNCNKLLKDDQLIKLISETADLITDAVKSGNKLMICGNGGSAADAQHIAGEFVCRFYVDRKPMPAIALSTDTSILTSISNDYSYDDIFSRQVMAIGKSGDVLLGISTSGSSVNVLKAFKVAKELNIKALLFTGNVEREIARFSDIVIKAPSNDTPRICCFAH